MTVFPRRGFPRQNIAIQAAECYGYEECGDQKVSIVSDGIEWNKCFGYFFFLMRKDGEF